MNFFNLYRKKIVFDLKNKFNFKSIMQVPKIKKIIINIGLGKNFNNKKIINCSLSDISLISGQKPLITKSKKAISNFNLRKNLPIGCKVTLRKKNMWNFFEKLVCIVIPRIRDFNGFLLKSFDGNGNYNIGINEQIIFPEINFEKIDRIRGMDINIVTSTCSDKYAYYLLSCFNFPFKKEKGIYD
ncbi:MAG: 50S ribosomal protein L5 [Enterobacteriaceae bacterium]